MHSTIPTTNKEGKKLFGEKKKEFQSSRGYQRIMFYGILSSFYNFAAFAYLLAEFLSYPNQERLSNSFAFHNLSFLMASISQKLLGEEEARNEFSQDAHKTLYVWTLSTGRIQIQSFYRGITALLLIFITIKVYGTLKSYWYLWGAKSNHHWIIRFDAHGSSFLSKNWSDILLYWEKVKPRKSELDQRWLDWFCLLRF